MCGETARGGKEHSGLEGADRPEEEGRRCPSLGLKSYTFYSVLDFNFFFKVYKAAEEKEARTEYATSMQRYKRHYPFFFFFLIQREILISLLRFPRNNKGKSSSKEVWTLLCLICKHSHEIRPREKYFPLRFRFSRVSVILIKNLRVVGGSAGENSPSPVVPIPPTALHRNLNSAQECCGAIISENILFAKTVK